MKKIIILIFSLFVLLLTACNEENNNCLSGLSYIDYNIDMQTTYGFDDWGSPGAALCVAVDTTINTALVVGLKFNLPLYSDSFTPNCNPIETTENYLFSQTNSVIESLATEYTYLADLLTNTYGIRSMNNDISAYIVIKGETIETNRFYVAIYGTLLLTREEEGDILEGDLYFAEISEASNNALIVNKDKGIKIENIYLQWDTETQPD